MAEWSDNESDSSISIFEFSTLGNATFKKGIP